MKKQSHTRLVRTLGYLVVCMTAGAALLSVAQPPRPSTQPPTQEGYTPAQAVADVSTTPARTWLGVVVHRTEAIEPTRRPLLSVAQPAAGGGDYHFLVHPDGRIVTSDAWREQAPIGTDQLGLHVALADSRVKTVIPRLQWNAFRELLRQLHRRFRLDPARIRLAETSGTDRFPQPPDQAVRLRNLLLSMGLSG